MEDKSVTVEGWFTHEIESLKDDPEFRYEEYVYILTEKICKVMEEKNISRAELAKRLDVSRATVSKMLNVPSNFTIKRLIQVAYALDQEIDNIVFRDKKKAKEETWAPVHSYMVPDVFLDGAESVHRSSGNLWQKNATIITREKTEIRPYRPPYANDNDCDISEAA